MFILTAVDYCTQAAPYVFIYEATYIDVSKIPTHRNLSNTSDPIVLLHCMIPVIVSRREQKKMVVFIPPGKMNGLGQ